MEGIGSTIEEDLFEPESRRSADVPHSRPIMRRQPVWVGIFTGNFPGIPRFHTQKLSGGKQVIKKFDGPS